MTLRVYSLLRGIYHSQLVLLTTRCNMTMMIVSKVNKAAGSWYISSLTEYYDYYDHERIVRNILISDIHVLFTIQVDSGNALSYLFLMFASCLPRKEHGLVWPIQQQNNNLSKVFVDIVRHIAWLPLHFSRKKCKQSQNSSKDKNVWLITIASLCLINNFAFASKLDRFNKN